jgi:hypothetical protein
MRDDYLAQAKLYKWFIVLNDVVDSGWEYRDDAKDALVDKQQTSRECKLVSKAKLSKESLERFQRAIGLIQ